MHLCEKKKLKTESAISGLLTQMILNLLKKSVYNVKHCLHLMVIFLIQ